MRHFLCLICTPLAIWASTHIAHAGTFSAAVLEWMPERSNPRILDEHPDNAPLANLVAQAESPTWRWMNDLKKPVYFRGVNVRGYAHDMELTFTLNRTYQEVQPGGEITLDTRIIDWLTHEHQCEFFQLVFLYWPPGRPETKSIITPLSTDVSCVFLASHLARHVTHKRRKPLDCLTRLERRIRFDAL